MGFQLQIMQESVRRESVKFGANLEHIFNIAGSSILYISVTTWLSPKFKMWGDPRFLKSYHCLLMSYVANLS
jgi:hypothetical protein